MLNLLCFLKSYNTVAAETHWNSFFKLKQTTALVCWEAQGELATNFKILVTVSKYF